MSKKLKTKRNRPLRATARCANMPGTDRKIYRPAGEHRKHSYETLEEAQEGIRLTTRDTVLQLETWSPYLCRHGEHYHIGRENKADPRELAAAERDAIIRMIQPAPSTHRRQRPPTDRKAADPTATEERQQI